jgi:hypothetical protein
VGSVVDALLTNLCLIKHQGEAFEPWITAFVETKKRTGMRMREKNNAFAQRALSSEAL